MKFITDFFNEHKQRAAEMQAIRVAPNVATLARILTVADTYDNQHALRSLPFGTHRERDDTGMIPPHLANLRQLAHRRATALGLTALRLQSTDQALSAMSAKLADTIDGIEWDLYSNNAGLSYLASVDIEECHAEIKDFIGKLKTVPPEALRIAPALVTMANPHTDDEIKSDRFWDIIDFANFFTRSAICENFSQMKDTIDQARGQLQQVALDHMAKQDPRSMAVINARIVRTPGEARRPRDPFAG